MKTEIYCLCCLKSIREEGILQEIIGINDVLCARCRYKLKYYPQKIKIADLKINGLYRYEGLCRELLIQYKEYNDEALYPLFLYPYIKELKAKYHDFYLVAIPSNEKSMKKRGFKHVQKMFSVLNLPFIDALYNDSAVSQKELSFEKRKNIFDHMHLNNNMYKLKDKKILLVDDIVTGGSTMKAAYDLIKENCRHVEGLVVAYNERYLSDIKKKIYDLLH